MPPIPTTPPPANLEANLSSERLDAADNAIEQDFLRNPDFLAGIDSRLTSAAHRTATNIVPSVAYNPTIRTNKEAPTTPIVLTGEPNNDLFRSFQSLNALIDQWLNGVPDNEREVMRQRYYNQLSKRIKAKIEDKAKKYEVPKKAIEDGADTFFKSLTDLTAKIDTNLSPLTTSATSLGATPLTPADIAGYTAVTTYIRSITDRDALIRNYNTRSGTIVIAALPPYFAARNLNSLSDFVAMKNEIITVLNNAETEAKRVLGTLVSPADDAKITAFTALAGLKTDIEKGVTDYSNVLRTHFVDPAGRPNITYAQILSRGALLREMHDQLVPPGIEEIMSREERFTNVLFEETPPGSNEYSFFHPRKSPSIDNPYTQGLEFSAGDYSNFYNWAIKNQSKLSPEILEAIEANTENLVNVELSPAVNSFLTTVNAAMAAGLNDPDQIRNNASTLVDAYFASTTAIGGLAPFSTSPDQANARYALIAMHYKLDPAQLTQKKLQSAVRDRVLEDLMSRINLPTYEQQTEVAADNLEAYGEKQNSANRTNYLASTRAKVQTEILKDYKDKDIVSSQENRANFTKDVVNKILQERLNAINKVTAPNKSKWYTNLSQKMGVDPTKVKWGLGLGAGALAAFTYLNPAILTPVKTFALGQFKSLSAWWAAKTGIASGLVKVAGTGLGAASGFLLGEQSYNFMQQGPFSDGKLRSKRDVLGSTDAAGNNTGGLGTLNSRTGAYNQAPVQSALAQQIAQAEKQGATFAQTQADNLKMITTDKNTAKFETADHLWQREKQGLSAIVNFELQQVMNDPSISNSSKANTAITNALSRIYGPGGVEQTFLAQLESQRSGSSVHSVAKKVLGATVGVGLGSLFYVTV